MSIVIIGKNMAVILLMALMGFILYKKGFLEESINKKLSVLVVDLCNPALSIACIVEDRISAPRREILQAVILSVMIYAGLILLGILLPKVLRIKRGEEKYYHMMTVYTNVGFIGLPLARAMLDADAMLYVIIFNVLYSFFFYTHGYFVMGRETRKAGTGTGKRKKPELNLGLISGIAAILMVWFNFQLPQVFARVCIYTGDANTFIAMLLLGASVASVSAGELVSDVRMYLFLFLRMLAVPVVTAKILTLCGVSHNMVLAFTLMLSMPMASMPLMLAERNGQNTGILSKGITISTIVSLATITLVLGVI